MIAPGEEIRIGVYVCRCGTNIAAKLDVDELAEFAKGLPHVVLARDWWRLITVVA